MIRAFIAIELDDALRAALGAVQQSLKQELGRLARGRDIRVQWVRPEAMHLTLKFLGDIDEARIDAIGTAVAQIAGAHDRMTIPVAGLGAFPDARAPRVLWAGLRDGGAVVRCAADLDEALGRLDFAREARPFSPHLTLARIKDGARDIGRALTEAGVLAAPAAIGTMTVHALALMRSDLRPSGSIYTRLIEAPLR
jgi:2'-5' RNA ligase